MPRPRLCPRAQGSAAAPPVAPRGTAERGAARPVQARGRGGRGRHGPGDVPWLTRSSARTCCHPEALRTAGFAVPEPVASDPARATSPDTPREPDTPGPTAEEHPALAPPRSASDHALIASLERALEQAQARELRLLDLLADLTRQRSAP